MLFFSKMIIKISVKIINFFKKIISFVWNILSYPLNIVYNFAKKIIVKPITYIIKSIKDLFSKIKSTKKDAKNSEILQKKEGFWILM